MCNVNDQKEQGKKLGNFPKGTRTVADLFTLPILGQSVAPLTQKHNLAFSTQPHMDTLPNLGLHSFLQTETIISAFLNTFQHCNVGYHNGHPSKEDSLSIQANTDHNPILFSFLSLHSSAPL